MVTPDVLGGGGGDTNAICNRAVAPRLAHAVAVHVAHAHVGHHLRWRHSDDLGVFERVHTHAGQPVIQPHGVCAGGEGLCKGVFAFVGGHQLGEAGCIHRAFVGELFGQGDGLAVLVQVHQYGHVFLRASGAHVHAVNQAVQSVGKVEFTIDQLVTHTSPARFFRRDDLHAILFVDTQHRGHHHTRAIGEGNETNLDFFFFRLVRALRIHRSSQGGRDGECAYGGGLQYVAAAHGGLQKFRHDITPM